MAEQKLSVKISGDSKELDASLRNTTKEINKVAKSATKAQQEAKKSMAQIADTLNKSGTQAASGLGKMAMGMSSIASWGGVIVGVLKQIHEAWEAHVVRQMERTLELSKANMNSLTEATDKNVQRWQEASTALKEYYKLLKQYQQNPSAVGAENLRKAERDVKRIGLPENMENKTEGEQLQFARDQELKYVDGAIKGLEKEQNRLDEEFQKVVNNKLMLPQTKNQLYANIQLQKGENEKTLEKLRNQKRQLERQEPLEDWQRGTLAEQADETKKKLTKAQEEQAKELQNLKQAQKSYIQALQNSKQAEAELAQVKKAQARDRKEEQIANRRERLQKKMGAFGFSLPEDFDVDLKGKALSDRRRQRRLDSSISEKISKQEAGERVHWTTSERKRIKELQGLGRQDEALEAKQERMEANEKKKEAKETLDRAKNAVKNSQAVAQWWRNRGVPSAQNRYNEARRRVGAGENDMLRIFAQFLAVENAKNAKGQTDADKQLEEEKTALAKLIKQLAQAHWNEEGAKHNRRNLESNRGYDPVVRGILEQRSPKQIDKDNARWLEGIYNNTKDLGGNLYIVK